VGKAGLITRTIPKLLDPLPGGEKFIDGIEFVVAWARANSLWPLVYGTACCAMEMMSTGASHHDWARFGVEVARATPRQADLIVLAGTIVEKMARPLVTLYQQMPGPKYVIAMGSCAISGGPFYYDSYSVIRGGDRLIPVDVYIPGCPPRPEALLHGIMELQKKIRTEGRRNPWRVRGTYDVPATDLFTGARQDWAKLPQPAPTTQAGEPSSKPARLARPTFPEVPRPATTRPGLSAAALTALVCTAFPEVCQAGPDGKPLSADAPAPTAAVADLIVPPARLLALADFLKNHPVARLHLLVQILAVDWQDRFDVVAHLLSVDGHALFLRIPVDHDQPEIPSLTPVFGGADWHERETYDLFGIRFTGHPDPRRLFLEDDFPGHPLRKDFSDASRVIPRPY